MESQDRTPSMSQKDVEVLVRLARIQVSAERLPRLTADLETAMRAAAELDAAADRSPVAGGAPFDAAWDVKRKRGRT